MHGLCPDWHVRSCTTRAYHADLFVLIIPLHPPIIISRMVRSLSPFFVFVIPESLKAEVCEFVA